MFTLNLLLLFHIINSCTNHQVHKHRSVNQQKPGPIRDRASRGVRLRSIREVLLWKLLPFPFIMERSSSRTIARQRSQGAKKHVVVPIRIVGKNSGYVGFPSTITKTIHSTPQKRQNLLIFSLMVFIVLFIPGKYVSDNQKA